MIVKLCRLVTVMFIGLITVPALCHSMEMPAKMSYEGSLWLTLLQTLYQTFGTIGAFFEVGAVVTSVILTFLIRQRQPAFGRTFLGALCMVTGDFLDDASQRCSIISARLRFRRQMKTAG